MKSKAYKSQFLITILLSSTICLFSQEVRIRIIKSDAVLRLKPEKESLVIKELPIGSMLDVEETTGEWIKAKLPPNKDGLIIIGYIHNSFVEFEIKQREIKQEIKPEIKPTYVEPPKKTELSARENMEDYFNWRSKLAHARAKQRTGLVISLTGVGILIPSLYYTFYKPYEGYQLEGWARALTIAGNILGSSLFVFGIIKSQTGQELHRQIMDEGRLKGYIKAGILPRHRAIGIQIGASF